MSTLTQAQINVLINLAQGDISSDNEHFNVMEYSGGNFDDAYEMGYNDGEKSLARHLCKILNIEI